MNKEFCQPGIGEGGVSLGILGNAALWRKLFLPFFLFPIFLSILFMYSHFPLYLSFLFLFFCLLSLSLSLSFSLYLFFISSFLFFSFSFLSLLSLLFSVNFTPTLSHFYVLFFSCSYFHFSLSSLFFLGYSHSLVLAHSWSFSLILTFPYPLTFLFSFFFISKSKSWTIIFIFNSHSITYAMHLFTEQYLGYFMGLVASKYYAVFGDRNFDGFIMHTLKTCALILAISSVSQTSAVATFFMLPISFADLIVIITTWVLYMSIVLLISNFAKWLL